MESRKLLTPAVRVRQAGLAWLDFSISAAVLTLFAGSLLTALLYYEEMAEATVVQLTVQNIRSGLRYQVADRLVQGRTGENVQLLQTNPFSWLDGRPEGYVGPVRTGSVESLPAGSWFYDVDMGEVGYVPKLSYYLDAEDGRSKILRWQVRPLRAPSPHEVEGLMVVAVRPYRWF